MCYCDGMEDMRVLKTLGRFAVWVQLPPVAPNLITEYYMENIKSVLSFVLIFVLAASIVIIMVGIMQWMDTKETQYAQSILVDTTSVSDTTNVDMPDINGRYKRAMLNPNSTDPIKGLTFSVWDD